MSIFGAIIFASFIMTSCGAASPEASGDAAASGDAGTTEVKAEATASQETMATTATAAPASSEVKAPEAKAQLLLMQRKQKNKKNIYFLTLTNYHFVICQGFFMP